VAAYYNEIEPFAAQWLRNLIAAGHIAPGDVDERSIVDVRPSDLRGYKQCHFFAGIGVWSHALRKAGWDDELEVWTGSCPCQPFSQIGKKKGHADERDLWPEFFRLIKEQKPCVVFGEQVASQDGLGWLDGVWVGMESEGYAFAAFDICAAGVGAPHIRQRLYWVGNSECAGLAGLDQHGENVRGPQEAGSNPETGGCGNRPTGLDGMPMLRGLHLHDSRSARLRVRLPADRRMGRESLRAWEQFDALPCADGWRRVQPGTFPLAHGVAGRVGRLRAYGNAIVAPQAQAFIESFMECRP